jgi:hypothetical protein
MPRGDASGPIAKLLNKTRTLLTSKLRLLCIILSLTFLCIIYEVSSTTGAGFEIPLNWGKHGSTYCNQDNGGSAMDMGWSERGRCEQLWWEERMAVPPYALSEQGMTIKPEKCRPPNITDNSSDEGSHDETFGCSDELAGFSLENEIQKGRSKFDVLQEMVSKTKGYYVRDYLL